MLKNKLCSLGVSESMQDLIAGMVMTSPDDRLSIRDVYNHPALKDEPDILKELGHTPQQQTKVEVQDEAQVEVQDEVVVDLQEQLANQKARADSAEKDLAEAKREIETLQSQVAAASAASAPGETGLEEGFSELRLQDASDSARVLTKIVLRTEKVINDGDIIPPSTFLQDPVKFGSVFAFEQVFNYYWKDHMKSAEDGGEYPDLDAFFSKYANCMTPAEDPLRTRQVKKEGKPQVVYNKYAKKYEEMVGDNKEDEKKRKKGRKDGAQAAGKAIAKAVKKAAITDTDTFSSVVDKIVVAIDSVFDHADSVDSFGVVKKSSRRTLATLLAAIHVSAGDEWGRANDE